MKIIVAIFFALIFNLGATYAFSPTDSTGLPGDHFDLYAMLDVFKISTNPEDFEKRLNTEKSHVNNLDLNKDGQVDYVRVIDHTQTDVHAIVLQVAVNENESQDIAVIEIEKKGENAAQLQVIGDELLYGDKYIIEPREDKDSTINEKQLRGFSEQTFVYVNVWYWPCVTYVYYPAYVVWVSPWYWMYYPMWWTPWPPVMWSVYYDWVYPCHAHYYYVDEHRTTNAHSVYQPRRVASAEVRKNTTQARKNYEERKNAPAKPTPAPQPTSRPGTPPPSAPSPRPTTQPAPQPRPQPVPNPPAPKPTPAPNPRPK